MQVAAVGLVSASSSFVSVASATTLADDKKDVCHETFLGLPRWYKYLEIGDKEGDPCAIIGPDGPDGTLDWGKVLPRIGLAIVEILLRIVAILSLGFTIFGGFKYITSQGEPDATKKAKGTVVNASIGLVIAIFAASIVGFVGNILWPT